MPPKSNNWEKVRVYINRDTIRSLRVSTIRLAARIDCEIERRKRADRKHQPKP